MEDYLNNILKAACDIKKIEYFTSYNPSKLENDQMILTILQFSIPGKKIISSSTVENVEKLFYNKEKDSKVNSTIKKLILNNFSKCELFKLKISVLKKYIISDALQGRAYKALWINKTKADNKKLDFEIFKRNCKRYYNIPIKKILCNCGNSVSFQNMKKHLSSSKHVAKKLNS